MISKLSRAPTTSQDSDSMISDPLPLSTLEELSVSPQSIDTGSNPGSIVHAANNQEFIVVSTIEMPSENNILV